MDPSTPGAALEGVGRGPRAYALAVADDRQQGVRGVVHNRRARHEFEILEELECGIALTGTEVKSLRRGQGSLAEAFARIDGCELALHGMHIAPYEQGNVHNHPAVRERRLLAHKREIRAWEKKVREKGVTIVPLALYFKGARVKVLVGLARGRKLHDKRAALRERSDRREIDRALARRR